MKTYKTYQARNAVKAAQVTNHIKAAKKNGVSHLDATGGEHELTDARVFASQAEGYVLQRRAGEAGPQVPRLGGRPDAPALAPVFVIEP